MRWWCGALLSGCATASTFQRADVLAPGKWEAGAGVSAAAIVGDTGGPVTFLMPRATFRMGVIPRVDLGGSVGLDGIRMQPKFQLTPTGRVVVSVSPGIRVLPLPGSEAADVLFGFEEAVLVGYRFDDRTQLVAIGRSAQDLGLPTGRPVLVWAGGSVGLSRQLNPYLRVMPEVGVMAPLWVNDGDGADSDFGAALLEIGVGVQLGNPKTSGRQ